MLLSQVQAGHGLQTKPGTEFTHLVINHCGACALLDYRLKVTKSQEMAKTQITGGCQCGAIKYQAFRGESKTVAHCYCQMCRKLTGGSFVSYAEFPSDGISFTKGQLKYFKSSEFAVRGFCGDCGCHVTYQYYGERDQITNSVWIAAGSLDNPESLVPTDVIYAPEQLPWLQSDESLPHWPGQMPWLRPGIDD